MLSVAAATTFSAVKPNSLKRSEALAEAPKCSSEIAMPQSPIILYQGWETPASTLTLALIFLGITSS